MAELPALDATTPIERLVLLAVAELDAADETPAYSYDVREVSRRRLGDLDAEPLGSVTRRDVTRALSTLADEGLVEERVDDESPTGKGRPAYRLRHSAAAVVDALGEDDVLAPVVERVRDGGT